MRDLWTIGRHSVILTDAANDALAYAFLVSLKYTDSDKDEKLKEIDALVSDTVESIDPHKEAQELTELLEKSNDRRVFEVKF